MSAVIVFFAHLPAGRPVVETRDGVETGVHRLQGRDMNAAGTNHELPNKTMPPRPMRYHLFSFVLFASAGTIGQPLLAQVSKGGPAAARFDTAAVLKSARPEIEAANAAWFPGLKQHDAAAIAAAYADSGLFVAADGTIVRGRAAVEKMYTARFERLRGIRSGAVVQEGLTVAGPALIYEWGHGWLELEPATPGASPVRSSGVYLTVWQRDASGHWRIVRNLTF